MNTHNLNPAVTKYNPALLLISFSVIISLLTRVILLIHISQDTSFTFASIAASFAIGCIYDLLIGLFIILPFIVEITFTNNFIYTTKGKWITLSFFALLLGILLFTSLIPKDFNKDLYKFTIIYITLRLAIFIFLNTRSANFRLRWRSVVLQVFFCLVVFLLVFNAVSEWFFWNEFSSRYNFIAVDYLIYTNEVVGNIKESYPIASIIIAVAIVAAGILLVARRSISLSVRTPLAFARRIIIMVLIAGLVLLMNFVIRPQWKDFSKNNYINELAGNGVYEFIQAFKNNDLDFFTYYKTIPDSTAFRIVRQKLESSTNHFVTGNLFDLERQVSDTARENKMNVVLISVESLSGSYLKIFGNTQNITPSLDSLANKGMVFTNLYALGTRTVRGLEALSLSIPPPPGQSMVKRPGNENLFSLGSVFKKKGYTVQYMYGGYGYFDNMNYFFGHNDYEVIDRTALNENDIHYANIWGVADEDLFTLALREMDTNYTAHQPFFSHIMTVSNHRPFTYPEGRIDISPDTQSREGAVKYTDYCIGKFIQEAAKKPWFSNTVFVIVADHCASSAGKQALPVTGYHIPMIIFSPGYVAPQEVKALTAQIDIAPTILGLLHFSYKTKFFGQDILNTAPANRRAFISTYQGLGFLKNDTLIIQSPVKKVKAYLPDFKTGDAKEINSNTALTEEAIAYYQVISWLIKHKKNGL